MAVFKIWDLSRQRKKLVIVSSLAEMLAKGFIYIYKYLLILSVLLFACLLKLYF